MKTVVHQKLVAYGAFGAIGVILGLALHRPEVVLLGAPFLVALVVGLSLVVRPHLTTKATLANDRVLEGDEIELDVRLSSDAPLGRVEVTSALSPGLALAPATMAVEMVDLRAPGTETVRLCYSALRWGRWPIMAVAWRVLDPGRFVTYEAILDPALSVRVHPRPEHLRQIVEPLSTATSPGVHTARRAGEGIEFADVRPFSPGDRIRSVNWRATARRGGALFVNLQHLERNTDVVLLVDTLTDEAVTPAVRTALRLAHAYSTQRDRIGIISFGGMLRWVQPGTGLRHLYRVLDALLLTRTAFSYVWSDPAFVPPRTLPTGALVIAITPLDDPRTLTMLTNLKGRGLDLLVVEVEPEGWASPTGGESGEIAHRIWSLHRDAQRRSLERVGIPVAHLGDGDPLDLALSELNSYRRHLRRVG